MESLKIYCPHNPKEFSMVFSCQSTGNYTLKVCKNCHDLESKDHLISEEKIQ